MERDVNIELKLSNFWDNFSELVNRISFEMINESYFNKINGLIINDRSPVKMFLSDASVPQLFLVKTVVNEFAANEKFREIFDYSEDLAADIVKVINSNPELMYNSVVESLQGQMHELVTFSNEDVSETETFEQIIDIFSKKESILRKILNKVYFNKRDEPVVRNLKKVFNVEMDVNNIGYFNLINPTNRIAGFFSKPTDTGWELTFYNKQNTPIYYYDIK